MTRTTKPELCDYCGMPWKPGIILTAESYTGARMVCAKCTPRVLQQEQSDEQIQTRPETESL